MSATGPHPQVDRLDLRRCSVFVDFDGTISTEDIGMVLLRRFADARWELIDERYEAARMGSRQWATELWPLLAGTGLPALIDAAEAIGLDPGFGPLVLFARSSGAELTVVSDGLGFYVPQRCAEFEVPVLANRAVGSELTFPFAEPTCPCGTDGPGGPCGTDGPGGPGGACGTCKAEPVRRAQRRGRTTVVIGDGTSDRHAAEVADVVFAKDRLVEWCEQSNVAYRRYSGLGDVHRQLVAMSGRPGSPQASVAER